MTQEKAKLDFIAHKSFEEHGEMYKIVDFLNKSLKDKKLMFGLTKDKAGKMKISIYEI